MDDPVFQNTSYNLPRKKSSKRKFILILVLLILITVAIFGYKTYIPPSKEVVITPTPAPTEMFFPTETPTPEITETPTPIKSGPTPTPNLPTSTPTPTKRVINPIDKSTGLDRSLLSIEVQNGGGVVGAASKGSEVLKGFGYKISGTGNADNYDYENVVIKIKSDKSNYLPLLKKDLSVSYSVGNTSADLSASSSADAVVIIGKQ